MSQSNQFIITDIDDMSIRVKLDNPQADNLRQIAKSLSIAEFKSVSSKAVSLFDFIDRRVPVLLLSGKGYEISVMRTRISLSFLEGSEFLSFSPMIEDLKDIKKEQLFSKENLTGIDSDFNFIVGLILGKLNIDIEKSQIEIEIDISKIGKFKNDFTSLLNPESKSFFGKISDLHLKEIRFKTEEDLFGTKITANYDFDETISEMDNNKSNARCKVILEFRHGLPLNTYKFLEATLSRVNNLTQSVAGGIDV